MLEALKLADFTDARNLESNTVTAYIRRHPEIFEGHTEVRGKFTYIDKTAEEELDKKYPLPKPVEVVEDTESRRELIRTQKLVIQLQQKIADQQEKLSDQAVLVAKAEAQQILLEDKEKQLKDSQERLSKLEQNLKDEYERINEEKKRADTAENEIVRLKGRSLWERIRNK